MTLRNELIESPLPVTLLTGFLDSGKTTVLNHLVRTLPRTAILMNEFVEVALDHQLLEKIGPIALLSDVRVLHDLRQPPPSTS